MLYNYNTIGELKKITKIFPQRFQNDDIATIKNENKVFRYTNGNWDQVTINANSGLSVPLYDLNSQAIHQLPPHTFDQLEEDVKLINENSVGKYFMLLNYDYKYFTLFEKISTPTEFKTLGAAVITCLTENGWLIKDVSKTGDNNFEIWVTIDDETRCFCLFNYDNGIVPYGV